VCAPHGSPAPRLRPRPTLRRGTRRGRGLSVLGSAGEGFQPAPRRPGSVGESDPDGARATASGARRHPARAAGDGGDGGAPADAGRAAGPAARVPRPRARAAPGCARSRYLAVIRLVEPLAARPPHLALGPLNPAVVE